MKIPSRLSDEEFLRIKAIDVEFRDSLRYIADIWLTVNQVTKSVNPIEVLLWGEYENRNIGALDHAMEHIDALIREINR